MLILTIKPYLSIVILGVLFMAPISEKTISFKLPGRVDNVTFDPARVSEADLRKWIQLSPEVSEMNFNRVPEGIEMCRDTREKRCSTDKNSPEFAANARHNLQNIARRIKYLQTETFPEELRPVVTYFQRIQEFALWSETQRLKFLQTNEKSVLEEPFENIDPKRQCFAEIGLISSTRDPEKHWELVRTDWHNCVLKASRIGEYPTAEWNTFLQKYGIREHVVETDND
jgi:hypothetical protein